MLITEKMNAAINEQIGNEFCASLQYVAIASYFAAESLPELSALFFKQSEEERDHAMRFVKYLLDAGARVEIPGIPATKTRFQNAEAAVKLSLDSEKKVTKQISDLAGLAVKEQDHITHNFLSFFLKEQLEEVSSMQTLLKMIQRAGEERLLHVESYLAKKQGTLAAGEPETEAT